MNADMSDKQNENSRYGWQQHHPRFYEVCAGSHGNGLSSTNTDVHNIGYPLEKINVAMSTACYMTALNFANSCHN